MIDDTLLKSDAKVIYACRDKAPLQKFEYQSINFYEHFITDTGYEIIILPFYVENNILDILKNNEFKISKRSWGNEQCVFAFKEINKKQIEKKYNLVLMTLFYSEKPYELERFYKYYRQQGVDHFFMYYNGDLSLKTDLPLSDDISYINWNFIYWCYINNSRVHHAQIPAMVSFHKKFLPLSTYALMIDTDEYLVCDNMTIKDYLYSNQINKNIFTRHCWAKADFKTGKIKYIEEESRRGKTVLYSDACEISFLPSVHKCSETIDSEIKLLHAKNLQKQYDSEYIISIQ